MSIHSISSVSISGILAWFLPLAHVSLLHAQTISQNPIVITQNSLPYDITQPGTYVLNSDLQFTQTSGSAISMLYPSRRLSYVTIDMQGHEIKGPSSGNGSSTGISFVAQPNVTIRNGSLTNFYTGISTSTLNQYPIHNANLRIENMKINSCLAYGVSINDTPSALISNCQISQIGSSTNSSAYGIFAAYGSTDAVIIRGCSITDIIVQSGGTGYCVFSAEYCYLRKNQLSNATYAIYNGIIQDNLVHNCAPFNFAMGSHLINGGGNVHD